MYAPLASNHIVVAVSYLSKPSQSNIASCPDASAIGTTVLQIKEIPERPANFSGAVCLFHLHAGEGETRKRLEKYGEIININAGAGSTPTIVHFSTHEAALTAKRAASDLESLCGYVDMLYNERSYDGRKDEDGLEDDTGR